MGVETYIVIAVILVIVGLAAWYVIKAKRSGRKCIGCPDGCCDCDSSKKKNEEPSTSSSSCSGSCSCSCCCGCSSAPESDVEIENQ